MKMIEAKADRDIKLDGIKAELTLKGQSVIRVILRDTTGNILEIGLEGYSGMVVLIPAPPQKKKVWNVKGEVAGINVNEQFDSEYEAKSRREELLNKLSVDESGFTVEQAEILEVA